MLPFLSADGMAIGAGMGMGDWVCRVGSSLASDFRSGGSAGAEVLVGDLTIAPRVHLAAESSPPSLLHLQVDQQYW